MKTTCLLMFAAAFFAVAAQPASAAARLGGLAPDKALEYMKAQHDKGLVIVEVNTNYWKLKTGFAGALHIPHDEMAER